LAKPILIGQSGGGLMMLGWAMRHPDKAVTLADYNLPEAASAFSRPRT
jgi:pimeloyl-ACP methyl ester carboxylesterase